MSDFYAPIMTIHVCMSDGQRIGEFGETEFRDKIFAGELVSENYYWHEGMVDWKPISEYRALAKTQRISTAPPMRTTVKIKMDSVESPYRQPAGAKSQSAVARFLDRIKGRIKR